MYKIIFIIVFFIYINFSISGEDTTMNNYKKEWEEIIKDENKGLTLNCLNKVNIIFKKSLKENNYPQTIKSLIYSMKYRNMIEEDSYEKFIEEIKKLIKNQKSPLKEILSSLLAELMWGYYENNRYKFFDRTPVLDSSSDDIKNYDLQTLYKKVKEFYLLSLENSNILQKENIDNYKEILLKYDTNNIFSTLYDFLVDRAFNFFINQESYLIEPSYKFEINDEKYFSDFNNFVNLKIETKDIESRKYHALLLFQKIIDFHKNKNNIDALVYYDIKRLKFVKDNSILENKDDIYIKSLIDLNEKFKSNPISSYILYFIADYYYQLSKKYVPIYKEEYKGYKKKSIEICEQAIKKFKDSFGAKNCIMLQNEILKSSFSIKIEKINPTNKPFLALVEYANIDKLYIKIIKLDEKEILEPYRFNSDQEMLNSYIKLKSEVEFEQNLPQDNDYNKHSVEIKIPKLNPGYYILLASQDKNFKSNNGINWSKFYISSISFVEKNNRYNEFLEFFIFDREEGNLLENVKCEIFEQNYNNLKRIYEFEKKGILFSDKQGKLLIKKNNSSKIIKFSYNDDKLFLIDYYYDYYNKPINKKQIFVKIFTDRAIYRPGQTIYFKGIVIEQDGKNNKILPDYNTTISFYDVNYQEINSINLKTNEFGTFSGTFIVPTDRLNGVMRLKANIDSSYKEILVEEYKRPKFEVTLEKPKESYKLNEEIIIKGIASAYSGANIDNGNVKYRVIRNSYFPYWCWRIYPDSNEMEITNGETKTNNNGEFFIKFKAIPDKSISKDKKPIFNYTIYADVTDINGETHSANISIEAGYISLKVDIDIPEKININNKKIYKIESTNLSNEYEKSAGIINIYKLKEPDRFFIEKYWEQPDKFIFSREEYYDLFKYYPYTNENNYYNWEKGKKIYSVNYNTEQNKYLNLENIFESEQGIFLLELITKDKYGEDINLVKYFTLYNDSNKLCYKTIYWYNPVKNIVEPDQKAILEIGSTANNSTIIYEIEKDNKIIKNDIILINNERKKIEFIPDEDFRGGFYINSIFVKYNRVFINKEFINVPWSNKDLNIEFISFRDKLKPGEKEEWKIKISGPKGEKVFSELCATMYDASLNAFKENFWNMSIYPFYKSSIEFNSSKSFSYLLSNYFTTEYKNYYYIDFEIDKLNWFGFTFYSNYRRYKDAEKIKFEKKSREYLEESSEALPTTPEDKKILVEPEDLTLNKQDEKINQSIKKQEPLTDKTPDIQIRKNFSETPFFYPHLTTNENGEIIISFTIPESLTKWKALGFAHTKDLKYSFFEKFLVTNKDLMVVPNMPRFFRENDKIYLTCKVVNLTDTELNGEISLQLFDPSNMKSIDNKFNNINNIKKFKSKKGESYNISWELDIPSTTTPVLYRIIAKSNNISDGEESIIPIVTNRILVTESLPLPLRKKGIYEFKFNKLLQQNSDSLKNEKLTFEFTCNSIWIVIESLPYLIEYPYECSEQIFSRYYANSISSYIINSNPKIKEIFEKWKSKDLLLSNLEKNQELKSVLLYETPWVLAAKNETERKKRVGLLFDLNKISLELNKAEKKLLAMQTPNNGFSWFPGLPDDRFITQYIVCGIGHLNKLNIIDISKNSLLNNSMIKAIKYMDDRIREDYEFLLKNKINLDQDNITYFQIHYLYTRSFYNNVEIDSKNKKAYNYWFSQIKKYWLSKNLYCKAMIALSLFRNNEKELSEQIIESLKQNSIISEELGMYWKENTNGYYWYNCSIETQSTLIEAFSEITKDNNLINEMRVWLLKKKQTENWGTTKSTALACYALLLQGTEHLFRDENIIINIGDLKIETQKYEDKEPGTGYFKKIWLKDEINKNFGNIRIEKSEDIVSWGALYWQYFENFDKITNSIDNILKINKKIYLQKNSDKGPIIVEINDKNKINIGDIVVVRLQINIDRNLEYVHIKDYRGSGFEPEDIISTYKYQDGLWYYQEIKDISTNFFIPLLIKGNYIFEYRLRATHKGNFSNGIATIQCMYAPEFCSHSEGIKVSIE